MYAKPVSFAIFSNLIQLVSGGYIMVENSFIDMRNSKEIAERWLTLVEKKKIIDFLRIL